MQTVSWFAYFLIFFTDVVFAGQFVVASYNLENFVGPNPQGRPVKPEASKGKIIEAILNIRPDVLAVQEIGQRLQAEKLQTMLKSGGLALPNMIFVKGPDPVINLAVFSRFKLKSTPRSNVQYLLGGRRQLVSRGFAEVEVQVSSGYSFILLNAHLKSKRTVSYADQAAIRLGEAKALRGIIDERLAASPKRNLIVVGDLNDTQNKPPVKALIGRGKTRLVDLRPFECNGDKAPSSNRYPPRRVTWTSYYAFEESYSRFDYILASPGMVPELVSEGTYIYAMADWGVASDHRPVVATFSGHDK